MKYRIHHRCHQRAYSLIESIIAMGVLAVACPLVFAVIAQAGKSGLSSEAETHSVWIVPACLEEIKASRNGCSPYFSPTAKGDAIPPSGEIWALAFSPNGKLIGKVNESLIEKGARESNGKPILYLATLSATSISDESRKAKLMNLKISISYPASLPIKSRSHLKFHTLIP